jgi:hypothetical protein
MKIERRIIMDSGKWGIIALLAFAGGCVTGYFVAKNRLEEDYQSEVQEYRERFLEKYGEDDEERDDEERDVQKSSLDTDPMGEPYKKLVTRYDKPDLSQLAHSQEPREWPEGDDEEPEEELDAETEALIREQEIAEEAERAERMAAVDRDEPYVIDQYQFENENDHYDKIDIFYYRFDSTVCDEKDVIIDDAEDILGWDFYKTLERKTLAYVRNEKLHSDFMIHSLSKSYAEDVSGWTGTDKEKEFWRVARKKEALDGAADDEE